VLIRLTRRIWRHRFKAMAIQLTPALEQRLQHIAAETKRTPEEIAEYATEVYVSDYEELRAAVQEADDQIARGECVPHEKVVALFRKRFAGA